MELIPISFIAGILTILAPCVLPVLPIVVGSIIAGKRQVLRPFIIVGSLAFSIVVFTLLLKISTIFITIPDSFWKWFSASIIFIFASSLLFPDIWAKIQHKIEKILSKDGANRQLAKSSKDESLLGAIFVGVALGPVFSACSPTFFVILGTVLPASFFVGLLNLIAYVFGLAVVLLLIAFAGQRIMGTLIIASDPKGWFKRGIGILFVIIAILILTGIDKKIETYFVDKGYGVTPIEQNLLKNYNSKSMIINTNKESNKIREISGVKLPLSNSEILSGGPPKDGIPPLDNPKFVSNPKAIYLNPADEGIGVIDEAGRATFYPFRILVWHEIVNTKIQYKDRESFPISITYCPLCKTAIAFEGVVAGKSITFGTSGKLWQSNLLMYDRQTDENKESLWSQVLGVAVQGPATGIKLKIYPSTITTFAKWKNDHPQTLVLSKETGFNRDYSRSPYGNYDKSREIYFPTDFTDIKIHPKTRILGLEVDGNYIAFEKDKIKTGKSNVTFAGEFITINRTKGDTITFTINNNQVPFIEGFWFSWQAVHPQTELY